MIKFRLMIDRELYASPDKGFVRVADTLERDFGAVVLRAGRLLLDAMRATVDRLYRRHSRPWKPWSYNRDLFRRTGESMDALRRSVRGRTRTKSYVVTVEIPWTLWVHETGARIVARGRYLAVPLPPALDPRGVPLAPSPRAYAKTFVRRGRRGNLVIYQRRGQRIVPLYALLPAVALPPRLGFREELDKELSYFDRRILDEIDVVLSRGKR